MIVAAAPLVSAAVAAGALGERLTVRMLAGSAVALAGIGVVSASRSGLGLHGPVWIVAAATVAQGVYHPLSKPLLRRYSGLEVATYGMVAGTVMLVPLLPFGWRQTVTAGGAAWLSAVYLGVLPSGLGFLLWGYALARLPVATLTSMLYLIPPVAVLIAYAWLDEVPLASELLGGLVVLAGVVTVTVRGPARARPAGRGHRRPGAGTPRAGGTPPSGHGRVSRHLPVNPDGATRTAPRR